MKKVLRTLLVVMMVYGLSACSTTSTPTQNQSAKDSKLDAKSPSLTSPKVRKVWVPEKIEGDKYIEGHWMWVLERTTTWSQ